jgi:hypothetical protein
MLLTRTTRTWESTVFGSRGPVRIGYSAHWFSVVPDGTPNYRQCSYVSYVKRIGITGAIENKSAIDDLTL